jgi:hypothetical protein
MVVMVDSLVKSEETIVLIVFYCWIGGDFDVHAIL